MNIEPPDEGVSEKRALRLTERQQALYEALTNENAELGQMYLSAVEVLRASVAEPCVLAAHQIREIMEKLPQDFGQSMGVHRETLGNKVRDLENAWRNGTKCHIHREWQGSIDNDLRSFLRKADEFFAWCADLFPRRRAEVAGFLQKTDPTGIGLPTPLENLNIDMVQAMRDFFVRVAHHGQTHQNDFDKWVAALEQFLLERLCPRTFTDMDKIDSLIKKAGRDDS